MKKENQIGRTVPILLILFILCFAFGCQQQVEEGLTGEEVQIIIDRDLEIWNEGNLSLIEEHISSDYLRHTQNGEAEAMTLDEYKKSVTDARIIMPDRKETIEQLIFQNNMIMARWKFTGTETGTLGEHQPTGVKLELEGVYILRIDDGKIAEVWTYFDNEYVKKQFGFTFVPPSSEEETE